MLKQLLLCLLCVFSFLGVIDVAYFHIYRLKLYRVPSSRAEHLTHLFRSFLFLMIMVWVLNIEAYGLFSLGLPLLLIVDFFNSLADVLLEPASRKPLGGLPPLEYAVHMLTMFVSGGIMTVAVLDALAYRQGPPQIAFHRLEAPLPLLALGWQIVFVTAGLCLYEGWRFISKK